MSGWAWALTILLGVAGGPQEADAPSGQGLASVSRSGVAVYHAPRDSTRARRILAFLLDQPDLPGLPPGVPNDVRVYLAPDEAAFDSLTGGRIPEWGAGVALPGTRSMVIPGSGVRRTTGWDEARLLRHEWAHLGLHQYLEGLRIPRWFNEGYAEWASGGWDGGEGWRLRLALAGGAGPDMDSLALRWPRGRVEARVAYMLSGTAVEYLVRTGGERGLEAFLMRWRGEGSFSAALRSVYGVTQGQFEEDWRSYVKERYGWLFVLSHSAVFWLFLTLLLLVLVWIRRRRDRAAMARLRATEPPDRPEFWGASPSAGEEPGGTRGGPMSTSDPGRPVADARRAEPQPGEDRTPS